MGLPININQLINGKTVEWDRIEFKEGWNPEAVVHSICAFANDINNWGGGYIIIGIKEKDGKPVFPPVGLKANQLDKIQKELISLYHQIDAYYTPVTQPVVFKDKHIFIIWVPGGDNRPYKAPSTLGTKGQKRYYIRRGSNSVIANHTEEKQLFEQAAKIPFDDRINHQADINDLSLNLIQTFLQEIKSDLFPESSKMPFVDLCKQMKIASGPDEYVKPLNVGLLLFCEHPEEYFSGAKIEVVTYTDLSGKTFTERIFTGPLQKQLRDVLAYFKTTIITQKISKVSGKAEAERVYNYPYDAIEEVLVNAIYHRSYENQSPVEINIHPNRIEILSFPGPLPPINSKALTQRRVVARVYRNRRIGDFLKDLKLTEGRATGFPTIYDALDNNNSPLPEFITDENNTYFLSILHCNKEFISTKKIQTINKGTASERKILAFCKTPKSRKEILEMLKISNQTKNYKKHILPLINRGVLAYTIPNVIGSSKQQYVIVTKK